MYSTEDFTELDKSKFKCFKFPNGNIYYGETVIVNEQNEIVTDKDKERNNKMKKINKIKLLKKSVMEMVSNYMILKMLNANVNMKVHGHLIKNMGEVLHIFQTEAVMKGTSKMINLKGMVNLFGNQDMFTLEVGKEEKWMVLENLNIEMGIFYKGNILTITCMIEN